MITKEFDNTDISDNSRLIIVITFAIINKWEKLVKVVMMEIMTTTVVTTIIRIMIKIIRVTRIILITVSILFLYCYNFYHTYDN